MRRECDSLAVEVRQRVKLLIRYNRTRANAFEVSLSIIADSTLIALSVLLLAKSRMSASVGFLLPSLTTSCAIGWYI